MTSLTWKLDPNILIAGSKDGVLSQFVFRDAKKPADRLNPVGLDISCSGDMASACSVRIIQGHGKHGGQKLANVFEQPTPAEEFRMNAASKLNLYPHEALTVRRVTGFLHKKKIFPFKSKQK